jgi:hypothetical protein
MNNLVLHSRRLLSRSLSLVLLPLLTAGAITAAPLASATEVGEPAEVSMAKTIVDDYRSRRAECAAAAENARAMCYYRLKVGLWDYKEAKRILAEYSRESVLMAQTIPTH